ncbi:MAG: phosphate/phosphite/phosphonate ABC transporter substrate-binding protein [Alphaproteobacteria bacterium]|uniref:phosphate/phosphite/phosphonate ABC transporter substrate-binding protein n=1 Tax=Nisaea sp. TaxID=2024842 RepID=UPI0032642BEB
MAIRSRLRVLLFLCALLIAPGTLKAAYIWSVVPQYSGIAVHRDWTPLLKHLTKVTGAEFTLKIYDTIPKFELGFLDGAPDFAYMNPYHAVMAHRKQGYLPIIRSDKRKLQGILVVRQDSGINTVQELDGKQIAFPSPNAFAAALYMRALLREKERIQFTPVYSGTHSNAYRFTLTGKTDASGAVIRTLLKERPEVQQALKTIYSTPKYPSHPLTVHPRVPQDVRTAVQKAILALNDTEEGRGLLKPILLSAAIAADYNRDYQPLELLKLEQYWVVHK